MDTCTFHPTQAAIEKCEHCGRPVCAACLWYAESGERLCPEHAAAWRAQGREVHAPEKYAAGIALSQAAAERASGPAMPHQGNQVDLAALFAATAGGMALAGCFGLAWLVPLAALGLSLYSLSQARQAHDPERTRQLSYLGLLGGGLYGVLIAFSLLACAMASCMPLVILALEGKGTP